MQFSKAPGCGFHGDAVPVDVRVGHEGADALAEHGGHLSLVGRTVGRAWCTGMGGAHSSLWVSVYQRGVLQN
jgi:hypothetical protein